MSILYKIIGLRYRRPYATDGGTIGFPTDGRDIGDETGIAGGTVFGLIQNFPLGPVKKKKKFATSSASSGVPYTLPK